MFQLSCSRFIILGLLTLSLHLKTYNFITCILCSHSHSMKAKTIRNYKRFHYAIPYTSRKVLLIPACTRSIKYVMKHNKIRHTTFVEILREKCYTEIKIEFWFSFPCPSFFPNPLLENNNRLIKFSDLISIYHYFFDLT